MSSNNRTQNSLLPSDYGHLLQSLKERIRSAQLRASLAVNRELVLLYWQIGRDILNRQTQEGWGAKVIERLSQDLKQAFPDMKGFSPRNLKYMRTLAEGGNCATGCCTNSMGTQCSYSGLRKVQD
jgi:predicted nuclease of restriction endonuclease-like (RecB) superfamily